MALEECGEAFPSSSSSAEDRWPSSALNGTSNRRFWVTARAPKDSRALRGVVASREVEEDEAEDGGVRDDGEEGPLFELMLSVPERFNRNRAEVEDRRWGWAKEESIMRGEAAMLQRIIN